MKLLLVILLVIALVVVFGKPFREFDTASLLPVKSLQIESFDDVVRVVTEFGEGIGKSWKEAVAALRAEAAGEIYFDTAEQIVFCDKNLTVAPELLTEVIESDELRPAAQVYVAEELRDAQTLHAYLCAHESGVTVGALRAYAAE